jgi:putative transposase
MAFWGCYVLKCKVLLRDSTFLESYTSVANFLNLDTLPVYGQTTEKPVFSGKRIKRGLYRTDRGFLCQSDVMGSYNILRKAFPNAFNRYGIERCVVHPRRINLSK